MEVDPETVNLAQASLFNLGESSPKSIELFPAVWSAAEALTFPDSKTRKEGLDRIIELSAARYSPLVAYIVATRLTDPDIQLRALAIQTLALTLRPDSKGRNAPEEVRAHIEEYLSHLRARQICALLEVIEVVPQAADDVALLITHCAYAGKYLSDLIADRKVSLPMRQAATEFIGRIGYCEAIPVLERLSVRLEARLSGQQSMPFINPEGGEEVELLPAIHAALATLQAP